MEDEFDYLKDSQFGKVARGILDKTSKAGGFLGTPNLVNLFATVATKYIDRRNRDLQAEQAKNINKLTSQYNSILGTRKEYFNSQAIKKQREEFQVWSNPETKELAILNKAIEFFNQDKDMINEFGSNNPYEVYKRLPENKENKKIMFKALELSKGHANNYFKRLEEVGDDAVVMPTQAEYVQEVKDAFQAAMTEAENDPTKQSFIRQQFLKAFGRDSKGNPRFGLVNQDKFKNMRINAEKAAGIGRDDTLGLVTDLDIKQREVEEREAFKRPDFSIFDFNLTGPITSKPNASDKRVLSESIETANTMFNREFTTKVKNDKGKTVEVTFKNLYDNIDDYNGPDIMEGQYNEVKFYTDLLTVSRSLRTEFERTNTTGKVKSSEEFLKEALDIVADRLSNGLGSFGFENITQVIEPNEEVEFTRNNNKEEYTYAELEEVFKKVEPEDRLDWIENTQYDKEYAFIFEILKRKQF